MAAIVTSPHSGGLGSFSDIPGHGGPRIEMVQNTDFSFPARPQNASAFRQNSEVAQRRPVSMHANLPPSQSMSASHRRAASTLPSFSFNAADTTGLQQTPPETPEESEENVPITPSRRGHRRGGSEFVGGDSRFGVSNALSSSPTKSSALPIPLPSSGPPAGRRGHAHRRSAAMSSHDVSSLMNPTEASPRLSHSLPTTPLEHPAHSPPLNHSSSASNVEQAISDPFGPPLDDLPARPPSRPRVGFDDNVTIIPRPLSTISSETESSLSTMRGHSLNNSISSMISMGTPSPQALRVPRLSISDPIEEAPLAKAKSSIEKSREHNEKEGEWLKSRSSASLKRPYSEILEPASKTTFVEPVIPTQQRLQHNRKHSLGHAFGFDRRKSEPAIGGASLESSRLSAVSLHETRPALSTGVVRDGSSEHVSSARKIKQWATSKIRKRSRSPSKALRTSSSGSSQRPTSVGQEHVSDQVPMIETPVAETNLDAVFNNDAVVQPVQRPGSSQTRSELSTPTPSQHSSFQSQDADESSAMLDLDAALGPFKTPPIGSHRQRRELHSNRLNRDFVGAGGHYHRRTESAPALQPFEGNRLGTPSHPSMADVFEEDEEEDDQQLSFPDYGNAAGSTKSGAEEELTTGVEIVDLDDTAHDAPLSRCSDSGLGIRRDDDWEPERPTTSHSNAASRLSAIGLHPRGSSIIEETIAEESSPVEAVEIVEAHEEPRTSSLTKSSDSSDTPTVLGAPDCVLTVPGGEQTLSVSDASHTSTYSSPDFGQRQASFDTSRLGTSASSMTDGREPSICTGDAVHHLRISNDDVPSLTSSRSTMLSVQHPNGSRRDVDTPVPLISRHEKRSSVGNFAHLLASQFSHRSNSEHNGRPQTSGAVLSSGEQKKRGHKDHRLKKLMFWRSKQSSKPQTN